METARSVPIPGHAGCQLKPSFARGEEPGGSASTQPPLAETDLDRSTALDQVDDQDDDRDYEQDVDEARERVSGNQPEEPEDQEYDEDGPEHRRSSFPGRLSRPPPR